MKSDPVSPQGRKTINIGEFPLIIETPPDLDLLLEKATKETPGEVDSIPYYSILWPSAIALAKHLSQTGIVNADSEVIELGCGLGLPSILCAKMNASVTATDFHPGNREWLLHNAQLNQVSLNYESLNWNTFISATPGSQLRPAQLVIGSDLIYENKHIAALVCAINSLCAPGGNVYIADPGRENLPIFVSSMLKSGWKNTLHPVDDIYILHFTRS